MADIHVDDGKLKELLAEAVKQMLADKQVEIDQITSKFLDDAARARREALKDIESSKDKFEEKAREKLSDAEMAITAFSTSLAEKKKKVEDALNVKIIGGFSAVMIVAALGAVALLSERIITVNSKANELSVAATALAKSSGELQGTINAANEVYKRVADSAKGTDVTSQLQTLSILTTRMDGDLKTINGELQKIGVDMKPLLNDYRARHSSTK